MHQNWGGVNKTVIWRQPYSVIENPIIVTKKILNLISELSKLAGYKVNIQKLMTLFYTNNELSQSKTKKKSNLL